ncbi:hypothetical protein [Streptomyces apocyni]|uniref:hypothetical protein n=1 Tax=Streptomyces apocyni TaxID=2654677 RepID=UPI0012EA934A|nr:hypothetical protein [Streptomyces apocyni]
MRIIHALILWASLEFGLRGHGRHRTRPAALPAPSRPAPAAPRQHAARARSPYGLDTPLNGEDTALVRPYLAAYEERQERARRRRRRLALVLAADFGIDLDDHLIGTEAAA